MNSRIEKISQRSKGQILERLKKAHKMPDFEYKASVDPVVHIQRSGEKLEEMKRKMTRIRKKCESGQMMNYSEYCAINSYSGWMKPCSSFRLKQKYIEPLLPYCERYYETNIKRKAA